MRGVFVDANESLAVIFQRLEQPGDPKVRVNLNPDITSDQYPAILDGAEIAIVSGAVDRLDAAIDSRHRQGPALSGSREQVGHRGGGGHELALHRHRPARIEDAADLVQFTGGDAGTKRLAHGLEGARANATDLAHLVELVLTADDHPLHSRRNFTRRVSLRLHFPSIPF